MNKKLVLSGLFAILAQNTYATEGSDPFESSIAHHSMVVRDDKNLKGDDQDTYKGEQILKISENYSIIDSHFNLDKSLSSLTTLKPLKDSINLNMLDHRACENDIKNLSHQKYSLIDLNVLKSDFDEYFYSQSITPPKIPTLNLDLKLDYLQNSKEINWPCSSPFFKNKESISKRTLLNVLLFFSVTVICDVIQENVNPKN